MTPQTHSLISPAFFLNIEAESTFLKVENLRKSFGDTPVLQEVSVGIERGKCLALLGPSGCGKSTLLNILAGLLPSDSGRIRCDSEIIEDVSEGIFHTPQERGFAMVFQDLSLWPHMTVAQNVAFGLDYLKVSKRDKEERVEQALKRVGIHEFRHRLPTMLSGGQQQRVAIARAIVVEPSVLLMDEPLASLDTQLREELRNEIAALIRRLGITTVYVTHDYSEAMTVAHKVAVMNKGRIEQVDTPEDIGKFPATTFVASFLNTANYFSYPYELEGLKRANGQQLFPPHPRTIKRGYLLVRKEDVEILPAGKVSKGQKDSLVRWEAVCIKNGICDTRHEVHARTPKGEVFRGFVSIPIPLDTPVIVQFDADAVNFVES